jgi:hypothetical protein
MVPNTFTTRDGEQRRTGMYQCPTCQADTISAMAVFSGKRMPVNCRSCSSASYRKLPPIIEVILNIAMESGVGSCIVHRESGFILDANKVCQELSSG